MYIYIIIIHAAANQRDDIHFSKKRKKDARSSSATQPAPEPTRTNVAPMLATGKRLHAHRWVPQRTARPGDHTLIRGCRRLLQGTPARGPRFSDHTRQRVRPCRRAQELRQDHRGDDTPGDVRGHSGQSCQPPFPRSCHSCVSVAPTSAEADRITDAPLLYLAARKRQAALKVSLARSASPADFAFRDTAHGESALLLVAKYTHRCVCVCVCEVVRRPDAPDASRAHVGPQRVAQ